MTDYTLERCITNDDNWEHYCELGSDEATAIEMWHYWQEKQPNYKFRMYKVTKKLVAMSGNPIEVDTGKDKDFTVETTWDADELRDRAIKSSEPKVFASEYAKPLPQSFE